MIQEGLIDFGMLDEAFQMKVIYHLLKDRDKRKKLADLNPFLALPGSVENEKEIVENNLKTITQYYNKEIYGKKLIRIYNHIVLKPVRQHIDKERLLSSFLQPENFHLLKWGSYDR